MRTNFLLTALFAASAMALNADGNEVETSSIEKRAYYRDGYKIFLRKRNAHACMMSIVFIVLFPLAAMSLHLPLRGFRIVQFVHAPIQLVGLAMMIAAMGLGIDIARNDLNLFASSASTKAHIVIGLLVSCALILFQPAMGLLQHLHYKRTGGKSVFAYAHRWLGRVSICLGWINAGLGYQLVGIELVPRYSLVREFVIMGVLGGAWFALVAVDGYRHHWAKKDKLSAYLVGWHKGPVFRSAAPEDETRKVESTELANRS